MTALGCFVVGGLSVRSCCHPGRPPVQREIAVVHLQRESTEGSGVNASTVAPPNPVRVPTAVERTTGAVLEREKGRLESRVPGVPLITAGVKRGERGVVPRVGVVVGGRGR